VLHSANATAQRVDLFPDVLCPCLSTPFGREGAFEEDVQVHLVVAFEAATHPGGSAKRAARAPRIGRSAHGRRGPSRPQRNGPRPTRAGAAFVPMPWLGSCCVSVMQLLVFQWLPRAGLAAAFSWVGGFSALSCAPEPRAAPGSNDGQQQQAGETFRYGPDTRGVECISSTGCIDGSACAYGECFVRCEDDRSCPQRQVWREGSFEHL
jgi:hypothetical protein